MSVSDAVNDLNSRDLAVRRRAAEQLAAHPDAGAAVPLVRACGDPDETVREWAVAALEGLGAPEATDAAALAQLLRGGHCHVRYWSATLLGRLGRDAASAVGSLSEATERDSDSAVRQRAAWALGEMGPSAAAARPVLARAAAGDDPRLARLARQSLEKTTIRQRAGIELWPVSDRAKLLEPFGRAFRRGRETHAELGDDPRLARLARQSLEKIAGS